MPAQQPKPVRLELTHCGRRLLLGLTGLVVDEKDPAGWAKRAVVLPAGWSAIEVERVWVRGRAARLLAVNGEAKARLES